MDEAVEDTMQLEQKISSRILSIRLHRLQTHIDINHPLELFSSLQAKLLDVGNTRIGNHNIDPSHLRDHLIDHLLDCLIVGDIADDSVSFTAYSLDLFDGLVDASLIGTDIVDDEVEAVAGQTESDGFAYPSRASGHLQPWPSAIEKVSRLYSSSRTTATLLLADLTGLSSEVDIFAMVFADWNEDERSEDKKEMPIPLSC